MTSADHPALALKLGRGDKQGAALEILDATTGKPIALILDGAQAEALEQLVLASPDLLWGVVRAMSHLNCDDPMLSATPERRRICKLLREVFAQATARPARK